MEKQSENLVVSYRLNGTVQTLQSKPHCSLCNTCTVCCQELYNAMKKCSALKICEERTMKQQCSSCRAVETVASAPRAILMGFIEQRKEEEMREEKNWCKRERMGKGGVAAAAAALKRRNKMRTTQRNNKILNNNKEFIPIMKKNGTQQSHRCVNDLQVSWDLFSSL